MNTSEKLLERIFVQSEIDFCKIPERDIPTPDYEVIVDKKPSYWEVKELSENDDEKCITKIADKGEPQAYCVYSDRIKNSIKSASRQFKGYGVKDHPFLIIIYDNRNFATKDFLLEQKLQSVMLGVADMMQINGAWVEVNRRPGLLTNRMRYISAIALVSSHKEDLWIYHNPYASLPLTKSSTLKVFTNQFTAISTEKGLRWVAI